MKKEAFSQMDCVVDYGVISFDISLSMVIHVPPKKRLGVVLKKLLEIVTES